MSPSSERRDAVGSHLHATARILKGAGLTSYARDVLREWDESLGDAENISAFRRSGVFGRAGARRAGAILGVLRARYLDNSDVRRGLGILARGAVDTATFDLLLGYHAATADELLFVFAAEFLFTAHERRVVGVSTDDALRFLEAKGLVGESGWSVRTATEVARKLLTAWRDFGILRGAASKRIAPPAVSALVIAWTATDRSRAAGGNRDLVEDPAFRLFLLEPEAVERGMRAARDAGWLDVHGGGAVVAVKPRFATLEALARAAV